MFEEMEKTIFEDSNGLKARSKIENVSGQSHKKPDDSQREKLL